MKKVLVSIVSILLLAAAVNADMIGPRVSVNAPGTHKLDVAGVDDVDTQTSGAGGIEYLHPLSDTFAVGLGALYTFDTKLKDSTSAFNFLPVYITGTYTPPMLRSGEWAPYVKANAGYDTLFNGNDDYKGTADMKGGFYWAAGIGTRIMTNWTADVMYSAYKGKYDGLLTGDVTYSTVGLTLGYSFSL
jgi:hypothetical protein